jgi:uncharacterized protein with PQ loop repeat
MDHFWWTLVTEFDQSYHSQALSALHSNTTSVNTFMFGIFHHLIHLHIIYGYYVLKTRSTEPG